VTLSNDTLESNTASYGGGLCVGTGGASVTLSNDTLESNTAGGTGDGGGLCVLNSSHPTVVTLSNDTLESNTAGDGGGLYVSAQTYQQTTVVTLANDTVECNRASNNGGGGGLCVYGGTVNLTNDTVESNTAVDDGGGLYVGSQAGYVGPIVTLTNDTVESNTASTYGGGIYIVSGVTVYIDSFTVANTINNTDKSGLNGPTANIDGTYILQNS